MSQREDIELQKYLHGDTAVSRRYHSLEKPEPGAALDAAILAAAHAEAQRPVRPRWMIPVALAATVVLGVGLSLQLQAPRSVSQFDAIGELDAPMPNAPMVEASGAPASVASAESDDSGAPSQAPLPELADSVLAQAVDEPAKTQAPVGGDDKFAPRPPRSDVVASDNDRAAGAPAVIARTAPKPQDPAPQRIVIAAEPAPAATPAPAPPVANAPQETLGAAESAATTDGYAQEQDEADLRRYARTLQEEDGEDNAVAGAPLPSLQSSFQASHDMAKVKGLRSAAVARMDAAEYLELIERTWRDGNQDAARTLMVDFRKKFPDYVLPESFPVEDPADINDKTPASPSSE